MSWVKSELTLILSAAPGGVASLGQVMVTGRPPGARSNVWPFTSSFALFLLDADGVMVIDKGLTVPSGLKNMSRTRSALTSDEASCGLKLSARLPTGFTIHPEAVLRDTA